MKTRTTIITVLLLFITLANPTILRAGEFFLSLPETDTIQFNSSIRGVSFYVFDLRDRETFIQFTPRLKYLM